MCVPHGIHSACEELASKKDAKDGIAITCVSARDR